MFEPKAGQTKGVEIGSVAKTSKAALGIMEHYPVNIGMVVKGLEYQ